MTMRKSISEADIVLRLLRVGRRVFEKGGVERSVSVGVTSWIYSKNALHEIPWSGAEKIVGGSMVYGIRIRISSGTFVRQQELNEWFGASITVGANATGLLSVWSRHFKRCRDGERGKGSGEGGGERGRGKRMEGWLGEGSCEEEAAG